MSRRRTLVALVGGTGAAVLAACGLGAPSASPQAAPTAGQAPTSPLTATNTPVTVVATPAPAPAATSATAQPRSGGMLRSGVVGDPPSLEGHLFAGNNFETSNLVFDQLTNYDSNSVTAADARRKLGRRQRLQTDQAEPAQRRPVASPGARFTSDDVKYNIHARPGSQGRRRAVRESGALVHQHRHA